MQSIPPTAADKQTQACVVVNDIYMDPDLVLPEPDLAWDPDPYPGPTLYQWQSRSRFRSSRGQKGGVSDVCGMGSRNVGRAFLDRER